MSHAQLSKLILMLSSEHDGEVIAAARAIGRTLKANGQDWHYLASIITGPHAEPPAPEPPAPERGKSEGSYVTETDRHAIAFLYEFTSVMNAKERTFIEQLYARHKRYGGSTFITKAQRRWLSDIYDRVSA